MLILIIFYMNVTRFNILKKEDFHFLSLFQELHIFSVLPNTSQKPQFHEHWSWSNVKTRLLCNVNWGVPSLLKSFYLTAIPNRDILITKICVHFQFKQRIFSTHILLVGTSFSTYGVIVEYEYAYFILSLYHLLGRTLATSIIW